MISQPPSGPPIKSRWQHISPDTIGLEPDQWLGNGKLVTFTNLQNFDCVEQPTLDLDFNGIKAQSDPNEMQTPICQVVTEPTADPAGGAIKHTAHLYVLVPMFGSDTNPNDAMACPNGGRPGELCGPVLGNVLISLFGFVPEAWKTHPAVSTQCPDPNNAVPGTCTMHASSVDLSVLLNATGKTGPPTKPVFVPTPNHSHVVDNSRSRWKQRHHLVKRNGRCGSGRQSGRSRLYFLPLLQFST